MAHMRVAVLGARIAGPDTAWCWSRTVTRLPSSTRAPAPASTPVTRTAQLLSYCYVAPLCRSDCAAEDSAVAATPRLSAALLPDVRFAPLALACRVHRRMHSDTRRPDHAAVAAALVPQSPPSCMISLRPIATRRSSSAMGAAVRSSSTRTPGPFEGAKRLLDYEGSLGCAEYPCNTRTARKLWSVIPDTQEVPRALPATILLDRSVTPPACGRLHLAGRHTRPR